MNKIVNKCNAFKSLTSELVPLTAVDTYFVPFVQHTNSDYAYKVDSNLTNLDEYITNRIKIIIYKNTVSLISNEQLREKINNIIIDYFSV